jgi:hypothetical protein
VQSSLHLPLAAGPLDLGQDKLHDVEGSCKFGQVAVREDMIKLGPSGKMEEDR